MDDIKGEWISLVSIANDDSEAERLKESLDRIRESAKFSESGYLDEKILDLPNWSDEDVTHWLGRMRVAMWNQQIDTKTLYTLISSTDHVAAAIIKLSGSQARDLSDMLIQIQASGLSIWPPTQASDNKFGGALWGSELPFVFLNWLAISQLDSEKRKCFAHSCVKSALIGGVPNAVKCLVDSYATDADVLEVLLFHRSRIESLRGNVPTWAWSQIRWALLFLPKQDPVLAAQGI